MRVAIGGGRTSNSYELLVHHVDPDKVRLFPVEDLNAEETTSVLSTPLQRSEYASAAYSVRPCGVVSTPESGSLTPEVETRKLNPVTANGSAGIGQREAGSSLHNTNNTGETPVPPTSKDNSNSKDNGQNLGRQSPDPSVVLEIPVDEVSNKAAILAQSWRAYSKKKVWDIDFRSLLQDSEDTDEQIHDVMVWMFQQSDFWAKESPTWELGAKEFDISNSRAFRTNYDKIRDSFQSWQDQVAATVARRKQKHTDDAGMTECMNALREEVDRQKTGIADELEEDTFDDDEFPVASEHPSSTVAGHADDEQAIDSAQLREWLATLL
jgi:hypothetical protein